VLIFLGELQVKHVAFAMVLGFLALGHSHAADTAPAATDPNWLAQARASIKAEKFDQAIQVLRSANETSSAEWNNLLGFSLRKKQPPDLAGAERFYLAALKIDPNHRGALEYYGMLKLTTKDLPGAEALLTRLERVCQGKCEEYLDLKQEIQKHKSKR